MRWVSQTHIKVDQGYGVTCSTAHIGAMTLAPEPMYPLALALGRLATICFHFDIQGVISPSGNRDAKIGNAWFHALAFEVRGLALITRATIWDVIDGNPLEVAVFDHSYLFLRFAHEAILRAMSHVTLSVQ